MLKKRLGIEAIERNWPDDNCSLKDYFKISSPILIIPEGCKRIGYCAFWGCRWLREVIIPESVERIGTGAFDRCNDAVVILKKPKSEFEFIGFCAFVDCKDVKEEIRN